MKLLPMDELNILYLKFLSLVRKCCTQVISSLLLTFLSFCSIDFPCTFRGRGLLTVFI